jgi:hypothetical protein
MELKYENMSLVELKQAAKGRRIKQYYIMKRAQLIQLLSLEDLPEDLKIEKMTIHELRDEAKRRGLRGFWTLRRERLVELLFPQHYQGYIDEAAPNKNEKNESQTNKHNSPENHRTEDIRI